MKKILNILIVLIISFGNFGAIYEIDAARNAATVFLNINNSPYSGFMKF